MVRARGKESGAGGRWGRKMKVFSSHGAEHPSHAGDQTASFTGTQPIFLAASDHNAEAKTKRK